MKKLIIILSLLLLVGCGDMDQEIGKFADKVVRDKNGNYLKIQHYFCNVYTIVEIKKEEVEAFSDIHE